MSTTVTSKGQVTIPKAIRDRLGLEAGAQVTFELNEAGEIVLRRADNKPAAGARERLGKYISSLRTEMTTDEIMALLRGEY